MNNEAVVEKPYTLRKLCADDIFPMCSILSKIGFKEIKNAFDIGTIRRFTENKDVESIGLSVGMDIVSIIIANMEKCKDSLYHFLSGLTGMTKKEIGELDMEVFVELIIDVVKKEEFKVFFKAASRFVK